MPAARVSGHRPRFLIHPSTAKDELYLNRRGAIHFRAYGMRRSHTTDFCVIQVHQDHVRILDERKQAAWRTYSRGAEYQSTLQELHDNFYHAQIAVAHFEQEQRLCKKSKLDYARRKLRKARAALQSFSSADCHFDVPFDSIFWFRFALGNGVSIMY